MKFFTLFLNLKTCFSCKIDPAMDPTVDVSVLLELPDIGKYKIYQTSLSTIKLWQGRGESEAMVGAGRYHSGYYFKYDVL